MRLEEILGKSKSDIIAIARVSLQVNQTHCDLLIETGDWESTHDEGASN